MGRARSCSCCCVATTVLLSRTKFGRYIYAIGGNAEAARRAGINLSRIRVLAFALCGLFAGITGILYASNLGSMSENFPGGQYVLYSVAGGGHRRCQPVRRPGPDARRGARRLRRRGHLQRRCPARARRGRPVHLDRRWCCWRRSRSTPSPAGAPRRPERRARQPRRRPVPAPGRAAAVPAASGAQSPAGRSGIPGMAHWLAQVSVLRGR